MNFVCYGVIVTSPKNCVKPRNIPITDIITITMPVTTLSFNDW